MIVHRINTDEIIIDGDLDDFSVSISHIPDTGNVCCILCYKSPQRKTYHLTPRCKDATHIHKMYQYLKIYKLWDSLNRFGGMSYAAFYNIIVHG